jgi:dihydrofolate reductase
MSSANFEGDGDGSSGRSGGLRQRVSLIAAVSKNGVIGREGRLPWNLPEDLKYFKEKTYGAPVIMGRKTYESIGRLLPGRKNIILSRRNDLIVPGAWLAQDLEAALLLTAGASEVFVIGGAEIYALALSSADRLYITEVDVEIEGDAVFPSWPALQSTVVLAGGKGVRFIETSREEREADEGKGTPSFRFLVFDRS